MMTVPFLLGTSWDRRAVPKRTLASSRIGLRLRSSSLGRMLCEKYTPSARSVDVLFVKGGRPFGRFQTCPDFIPSSVAFRATLGTPTKDSTPNLGVAISNPSGAPATGVSNPGSPTSTMSPSRIPRVRCGSRGTRNRARRACSRGGHPNPNIHRTANAYSIQSTWGRATKMHENQRLMWIIK